MPSVLFQKQLILEFTAILSLFILSCSAPHVSDGIVTYYIRLDHYFSAQKSVDMRVTMIPAKEEFRTERFSIIEVKGLICADRQSAGKMLEPLVQKDALSKILENYGLKSIQALNQSTTVSYEGVMVSPLDMSISGYDTALGRYAYTCRVKFAPLAFPDRWELMKQRYNVRKVLNGFFLLFE